MVKILHFFLLLLVIYWVIADVIILVQLVLYARTLQS